MNATKTTVTLSCQDLEIGYMQRKQPKSIASDINFELHAGELVALVGRNGIGKSTLLRTLSGVQPPLHGNVFIENHLLSNFKSHQLATKLSLVLTDTIVSKNILVRELIALGRHPYTNWIGTLAPKDEQHVQQAIEMVQIKDIAHLKCYELSDGQLQKVLIARALAQDTPLIILDEPTSHLDIYHKAYIFNLLKRLAHQTQKTILCSTHEIDFAIQLCDKIAILTPSDFHFDTADELIKKQHFSSIFPEGLVHFDPLNKSFKINS